MRQHAQQAAARFDDWAETYGKDRISPWFRHYQALAMERLPLMESGAFLDVGCGTGWAVRQAAGRPSISRSCGIDISPKMIEKARELTMGLAKVELRVADAAEIPYPDDSFSSILCTCSFHHYADPVQALRQIRRVLRPGGRLALLDSARDVHWAIRLQDLLRRRFERSHVRYYSASEMIGLVSRSGLALAGEVTTFRRFWDHRKAFTGLMLVECTP